MLIEPRWNRHGRAGESRLRPAAESGAADSIARPMAPAGAERYGLRMLPRIWALLAERRFRRAADIAVAGLVLGASLAEIAAGREEWSGPRAAEIAIALLAALPLVERRRRPLAAAACVVVAALASALIVAPVQGPFETFAAYEIAFYSVGVYAGTRRGLVAVAISTVLLGVATIVVVGTVDGVNVGDWLPMVAWAWAAYGVGRVIGNHSRRTAQLERLTAALAAERDARAAEAVSVERARIARELHDVVAHNVSVMSVQAMAAGRILAPGHPEVQAALQTIERTGRATIDEMRRMLGALRDDEQAPLRLPQPSLDGLEGLAAQVREAGLAVEVHVEGDPVPLPAGLALSAYRIAQEGLTNALKHAGASHATVTIRYDPAGIEVEVVDDGIGTTGDGSAGGHGLVGMRERAALFGGRLEAGPRPSGGWSVRVRMPVEAT
jgi:signal transduction histidine kinase